VNVYEAVTPTPIAPVDQLQAVRITRDNIAEVAAITEAHHIVEGSGTQVLRIRQGDNVTAAGPGDWLLNLGGAWTVIPGAKFTQVFTTDIPDPAANARRLLHRWLDADVDPTTADPGLLRDTFVELCLDMVLTTGDGWWPTEEATADTPITDRTGPFA